MKTEVQKRVSILTTPDDIPYCRTHSGASAASSLLIPAGARQASASIRAERRGLFLEDELHAPWSETRRQRIEGTGRLCVHHLADQYLALHRPVEAEVIMRQFWTTHPTDEDALLRLITLLTQQARMQEALQAFSYTERFLWKQEHRRPSARLMRLAEQLRYEEGG